MVACLVPITPQEWDLIKHNRHWCIYIGEIALKLIICNSATICPGAGRWFNVQRKQQQTNLLRGLIVSWIWHLLVTACKPGGKPLTADSNCVFWKAISRDSVLSVVRWVWWPVTERPALLWMSDLLQDTVQLPATVIAQCPFTSCHLFQLRWVYQTSPRVPQQMVCVVLGVMSITEVGSISQTSNELIQAPSWQVGA